MTITWPKAIGVIVLLIVPLLCFFQASGRSFTDNRIVFLREHDPVPEGAVLIEVLRLSASSYADSCAWFELLLKGSRIASSRGGNLVKIREREDRQQAGCDALALGVYKVDSPHNADREFRWSAERKLRWADFQGGPRDGCGAQVAAETSCGISVETSLAPATARARIYVFNSFDKRQSWVRRTQACGAVLRHEQGHWDLCEIYTRRMQARFDAQQIRGARLNEVVERIYDEVEAEYVRQQESYERETAHGTNAAAQERWELRIARELQADAG